MIKVRVFLIPGDSKNEHLLARLRRLATSQAEVFSCPRELATFQPVPFLEVEGGERFYGEEGISVFCEEQEAAAS